VNKDLNFKKGDTISINGDKVICVSKSVVFQNCVSNYLLPFSSKDIPESRKCFTNGSKGFYPGFHRHSKCVLTEKTYPFFKRRG
jgi:hypothetical protein